MSLSKKDTDLTKGNITKSLILYFLPIAAGNFFQQFYNAVDSMVVGKFVGTQALASVGGSAANLVSVFTFLMIGLLSGSSVVISQQFGSEDYAGVSKSTHTSMLFTIILGAVFTVLLVVLAPWLLTIMKTTPDTFEGSLVYMRIYFSGSLFFMIYNTGSGILRAIGDSSRPFIYLVISSLVNIALDLLFVIAFSMGVAGVALATIISQGISAMLVLIRLTSVDDCYRLDLKKLIINRPLLHRMMSIGIPSFLQSGMYNLANTIVQVAVNVLGTTVVASWALSNKIDGFVFGMTSAAGTAVVTFVGQNYGAGKIDRIKKSIRSSLIIFVSATIVLCTIIMFTGHLLLNLFTDDLAVIELTWRILRFLLPFYCVWAVVEIYSSGLRGANDVIVPVIINLAGVCILRITWIAIVFRLFPNIMYVAAIFPISWAVTAVPTAIRYYRCKWAKLWEREFELNKKALER